MAHSQPFKFHVNPFGSFLRKVANRQTDGQTDKQATIFLAVGNEGFLKVTNSHLHPKTGNILKIVLLTTRI